MLPGLDANLQQALDAAAGGDRRLAGLSDLRLGGQAPAGAVCDIAGGVDVAIVLPEGALGDAELGRLRPGDWDRPPASSRRSGQRLADASFTARAPADVVAGARERAAELERKIKVLAETLGLGA